MTLFFDAIGAGCEVVYLKEYPLKAAIDNQLEKSTDEANVVEDNSKE